VAIKIRPDEGSPLSRDTTKGGNKGKREGRHQENCEQHLQEKEYFLTHFGCTEEESEDSGKLARGGGKKRKEE